jgi:hypothetical protein
MQAIENITYRFWSGFPRKVPIKRVCQRLLKGLQWLAIISSMGMIQYSFGIQNPRH